MVVGSFTELGFMASVNKYHLDTIMAVRGTDLTS